MLNAQNAVKKSGNTKSKINMQIEHTKLLFKHTCPLIDKGISAVKEKLEREFEKETVEKIMSLITPEIEELRELNSKMRVVAESQLSLMNHELKNLSSKDSLGEVPWLWQGHTEEYTDLKKQIAHICRDVTKAGCIDEVCINDVILGFKEFGYKIIKR